jgi:hypothetical protein
MNTRRMASLIAAACLLLMLAAPAPAQGPFTGTWIIDGATLAPWAKANYPEDEAQAQRSIGQTVRFSAKEFVAPRNWMGQDTRGCRKPQYTYRDAEANTLFEGGLNKDGADRPLDAVAEARKLGITAPTVFTVMVLCDEGLEFFLTGPDTVQVAVDNRIYSLHGANDLDGGSRIGALISGSFSFWFFHAILAFLSSLPIVWFARRRVDWRRWELLVLALPFGVWGLLTLAQLQKKSGGNLIWELTLITLAVPVAALLRAAIGPLLPQRKVAATLIGLLCLLAAGLYFFTPLLPEE